MSCITIGFIKKERGYSMRMSVLKKGVKKAVAFTAALSLAVTSNSFGMAGRGYAEAAENLIKLSDDDVNNLYKEVSSRRQSVHDIHKSISCVFLSYVKRLQSILVFVVFQPD